MSIVRLQGGLSPQLSQLCLEMMVWPPVPQPRFYLVSWRYPAPPCLCLPLHRASSPGLCLPSAFSGGSEL